MNSRTLSVIIRLTCLAAIVASLSGCIIYVDHDDDFHTSQPAAPADEKPAQTGSF
ncbi:MAG: hypothetical protein JF615_09030 [Asticcacaulis sp.]|nr:hypothetical protein [Asticcacaulis sp.]